MGKGISPLIAAVFLIAFTMAVAGIFSQWAPDLMQSVQTGTSEDREQLRSAVNSDLEIARSSYDSNTGNTTVTFQNTGDNEMSNFTVTAVAGEPVQKQVTTTLDPAGITTVSLNTSGEPEKISVASQNLAVSDTEGEVESDTTRISAPSVDTLSAVDINAENATLRGDVLSAGGETPDTGFNYGTSDTSLEAAVDVGSNKGEFSQVVTGLNSDTTYYYEATASNSGGSDTGSILNFTTEALRTLEIVDDFEDGDMSEYTEDNGGYTEISTSRTFNGSYSLYQDASISTKAYTNSLENLPSSGEEISLRIYIEDLQTAGYYYWTGVEDTTHDRGIGASIVADSNNADFMFGLQDRCGEASKSISISDPRGEWLKIKLNRSATDNHTSQLRDAQGNLLANLSITSSCWSENDYMAIHANDFGSGGRTGDAYWDYITKNS